LEKTPPTNTLHKGYSLSNMSATLSPGQWHMHLATAMNAAVFRSFKHFKLVKNQNHWLWMFLV